MPCFRLSLRTRSSSSDRHTNLCETDSATLAAPRVRANRRSPRTLITWSILSTFPHHFPEELRNLPISHAIISPSIPQSVAVGFGDCRRRRGLLMPPESASASSASASAAVIATVGVLCFTFARGSISNPLHNKCDLAHRVVVVVDLAPPPEFSFAARRIRAPHAEV